MTAAVESSSRPLIVKSFTMKSFTQTGSICSVCSYTEVYILVICIALMLLCFISLFEFGSETNN